MQDPRKIRAWSNSESSRESVEIFISAEYRVFLGVNQEGAHLLPSAENQVDVRNTGTRKKI